VTTPSSLARSAALAAFHADVSPRLLAELRASGVLAGADAAIASHEWLAASLHACVRGVLAVTLADDERADLVDAFHDTVLSGGPSERAFLATRYEEYDGLSRTLGQKGAARVPGAIATAFARHTLAADVAALTEAAAPVLEALAEGAEAVITRPVAEEAASVKLPPLFGLLALTERLDGAGLTWALGGSGLLAALGLVDRVNDWDVQVDSDPEPLRELFADMPHTFHGHGGCHADWKLSFDAEATELIPRFAFFVPGGVVRIPLHVSRRWSGLPIASPEGWACAYALMGEFDEPELRTRRAERADFLFGWLSANGTDRARLAELTNEPLPGALRARLEVLARTGA
jgi:hypothetical protein